MPPPTLKLSTSCSIEATIGASGHLAPTFRCLVICESIEIRQILTQNEFLGSHGPVVVSVNMLIRRFDLTT